MKCLSLVSTVAFAGLCFSAPELLGQSIYKPYSFTTLAGNGGTGSADGPANAARFNFPEGGAFDSAGNLYIADYRNSTIRKITPSGSVSTFAGSPTRTDFADGVGAAARFNHPTSVALDSADNIYVADTNNHVVRKITPAGMVTTLAGGPETPGSFDGQGFDARFNLPRGVAVDSTGNVYIGDSSNQTIRKITPGGLVSTFAGSARKSGNTNGSGSVARFSTPRGLALDSANILYVADYGNNRIRKITPDGTVSTLAGSIRGSTDGLGTTASFSSPVAVVADSASNLYVADSSNSTIRKITPAGDVTTLAGIALSPGSSDGSSGAARFSTPYGVAVNSTGLVYVCDSSNNSIRKVTSGGVVSTFAGLLDGSGFVDGSGSAARMNRPNALAIDAANNIYLGDTGNNTIRRITPGGLVTTFAGTALQAGSTDGAGSAARFNKPGAIVIDSGGNLFVADTGSSTIRKITPGGFVTTFAGTAGVTGSADGSGTAATFNNPGGIAMDGAGYLYVADSFNNTIRKINPAGDVITFAGTVGTPGLGNGNGTAALFRNPQGLAVDGGGNIYVADSGNNAIRKITPAGDVTVLAGTEFGSPVFGSGDGMGADVQFSFPQGVAVDGGGNVYVVEGGNGTVRRIAPNGFTNTLAGVPSILSAADGKASAALFALPGGIAVKSGKLYVADTSNNTVRVGQLASASLLNISTRLRVQQGDNVLIGGFIATGTNAKGVLIRGIGPSLANFGITGFLPDPTIELRASDGRLIESNDDWRQSPSADTINLSGLAPSKEAESAIITYLFTNDGYTATLRGKGDSTGIGVAETYSYLGETDGSQLANISTRGFVEGGDNVMIGGFILGGGTGSTDVMIRAIGPSLIAFGFGNALSDPTLELHDVNGVLLASNDNWKIDDQTQDSQEAKVRATTIPPTDNLESALVVTLTSGNYTAIVAGKGGGTGVALVEVYNLK